MPRRLDPTQRSRNVRQQAVAPTKIRQLSLARLQPSNPNPEPLHIRAPEPEAESACE
uniref:Uncharacterized protein n=1 Tax=Cucumis melo TaxID=3656 RepID=A0A9I9ECB4_CUCME